MKAGKGILPKKEYVGFKEDEAQARVDKIVSKGGIAWLEDSYGSNMSGVREWMGFNMVYFTRTRLRNYVLSYQDK
jgi:hypothetical protein